MSISVAAAATPSNPAPTSRHWQILRRVLHYSGTIVAVVVVWFFAAAFAVIPMPEDGPLMVWHGIGMAASFGAAAAMVWRMKWPRLVLAITCAGALALPLDPVGPSIALSWVIARCSWRTLLWAAPAALAAIIVSLSRDFLAGERGVFVIVDPELQTVESAGIGTYVGFGSVCLVVAVAAGLVRKSRAQSVISEQVADRRSHEAAALRYQVERQEEREMIAREMHDTVAHQLSLLSLRAASLEVTSGDPAVPESARAMRASAHLALDEMRGLISSLRDSSDGGYLGGTTSLTALQTLVAETMSAGVLVSSMIHLPHSPQPPGNLLRAAFRIVQESLTNVIKHAPGSGIGLQVTGGPGDGVSIEVTNWLHPDHRADAPSARAGVVGMTERAESVGGNLTAGAHEALWVVRAWLPWKETV